MSLPQSFVDRYLEVAKGMLFMGQQLDQLTKEELIAIAVCGWKAEQSARDEGIRQLEFMSDLRRASSSAQP